MRLRTTTGCEEDLLEARPIFCYNDHKAGSDAQAGNYVARVGYSVVLHNPGGQHFVISAVCQTAARQDATATQRSPCELPRCEKSAKIVTVDNRFYAHTPQMGFARGGRYVIEPGL